MKNVDKGFELIYFNLSHRRKFIRTIWITVFGLIFIPLISCILRDVKTPIFSVFTWLIIFELLIIVVGAIQAIYEYRKWQAETENQE